MQTSQTAATSSANLLDAASDETPTMSVVLPTLNEETGVAACLDAIIDAIDEIGCTAEIIVSDSSTDRTPEIAREYGAIVVSPDRRGYGYAYRYAFERARGEYIVMGDADTTYDFGELPKLFGAIRETEADLVLGSRFAGEIRDGAMPWLHKHVGNPALTAFLNRFYDADISDAHTGFRVLRREALDALTLRTDGMEFASEMIMEASARGLHIEEVPITYHPREGDATLDTWHDGWKHLRFMLLNAPGYLFTIPGAVSLVAGAVLMLLAFFDVTVNLNGMGPIWFGIRTMVAGSLLTIVGFQIASLGVFATIASEPIRRPTDRVTTWLVEHLRLETGIAVGGLMMAVGGSFAASIVLAWLRDGYASLPPMTRDILAFTCIVLGIQTVFAAFFVTAVRRNRR
ncbi:glycosyltransferase family 2 protein [Halosimplex pelagicum]|uniref:glycosyltransferase family 2 protein n=1 Tax=Halosimplex pelagicum TaxID=869886 RepID=UPI001FE7078C|nr:glycosyltransferase family 2 protein [Halosimplex pelagicum]